MYFLNIEILRINNSNKCHFTTLFLNNLTQELICGDDKGGVTFVKIFNKSEIKLKPLNENIIQTLTVQIFPNQEHIITLTENSFDIFKVKREAKISNKKYHDAEIIKLFVVEPIRANNKIIEDTKY